MSEPYEGPACPFCGSDDTLYYNRETAALIGFRTECRTCQTRWNFPSGYPADFGPVVWPIAAAAFRQPPGGDAP